MYFSLFSDDFRGNRNELIRLILQAKFGGDPFGLILGAKLKFNKHLKSLFDLIFETTSLIRKFQPILQELQYLLFIKLLLDHILIIGINYDQT